jgi:hypothetical protein
MAGELLDGVPSASPGLDSLQISGYQFRSQPYVAVPRTAHGFYSSPVWMRLERRRDQDAAVPSGATGEPWALALVLDPTRAPRVLSFPDQEQLPELERVTITVPTVFGTVMHVDVVNSDRSIGSL